MVVWATGQLRLSRPGLMDAALRFVSERRGSLNSKDLTDLLSGLARSNHDMRSASLWMFTVGNLGRKKVLIEWHRVESSI